ncbi:hypothetical protein ABTJ74_19425, partial [Acinetobacter baumannii]
AWFFAKMWAMTHDSPTEHYNPPPRQSTSGHDDHAHDDAHVGGADAAHDEHAHGEHAPAAALPAHAPEGGHETESHADGHH